MRTTRYPALVVLLGSVLCLTYGASGAEEPYKFGPDSQRQDGVPKGTVTKHRV